MLEKTRERIMERIYGESPLGKLEEPAAVFERLSGKRPNPATCQRWGTVGILGVGGDRIRLELWYQGRQPRTTEAAALEFMAKVTAAKRQRLAMKSSTQQDTTHEELRAAGLVDPDRRRAESNEKVRE